MRSSRTGLRDLHAHIGAVPLLLWRWRILLHGRGRGSAGVGRFLERLAPFHGGLGRWRWLLWLLAAAAPLKRRKDAYFQGPLMTVHRVGSDGCQRTGAIDGVAKSKAATQTFPVQGTEQAQEAKRPQSMTRGSLYERKRTRADTAISPVQTHV
jgi:hypothetical protein